LYHPFIDEIDKDNFLLSFTDCSH